MKNGRRWLWVLAGVYTISLPEAIRIYRAIVDSFSTDLAGKIPLVLMILLAIAYIGFGFAKKRSGGHLLYFIPCVAIAIAIISLVKNPNKHIHIPEYILLTGILYAALKNDYQGRGLFLLIFFLTVTLGVVDELAQGFHLQRHYGLQDIGINAASALMGVLLLQGICGRPKGGWERMRHLRHQRGLGLVVVWGFCGMLAMCLVLENRGGAQAFADMYPLWLWAWNGTFWAGSVGAVFNWRQRLSKRQTIDCGKETATQSVTVQAWLFPMLIVLLIIHLFPLLMVLTGREFS